MHRRPARALSIAAACLLSTLSHAEPQARLTARLAPDVLHPVGGLSGIELSEDGTEAMLLSDRGWLFRAEIARDAAGHATALTITETYRLRHDGETRHPDSEGLALRANGDILISTENPTRLLIYRWGMRAPIYTPDVPTRRPLDDNRGLEALALAPDGAAVALFETPDGAGFALHRFKDGAWSVGPSSLPATPGFRVVGADFDDAGRLYVLERAFSLLGFRTRVRRADPRTNPMQVETLLETRLGAFDNLEGIAWSRAPGGASRITLISDDNFQSILRTELVEFTVAD